MAKLSLLLALLIFFTPSLCCPEDQKQALLEFKSSLIKTTSSPSLEIPLFELESWNSSSDCCNWKRVICSTRFHPRTVIALYLDSLVSMQSTEPIVVTSTILTPLFRIRSLMLLDMTGNQIQGELPGDNVANLSKLVYLDLKNNIFNGSISSQLFHLRYLQYLDLSINSFHGILIGEVGSLQNLRVLNLEGNSLVGNIPKEIGNMTKLRQLYLRNNSFFGEIPSSFLYLKELEVLDLRDNFLSKKIPNFIGSLSNIISLELSNKKLTGRIPSSIKKLKKLETLQFENNLLSGEIPSWLFNIKSVKRFFWGGIILLGIAMQR
ncbi:hypothetical protein ACJW31_08G164700 [Castanea mollissima]